MRGGRDPRKTAEWLKAKGNELYGLGKLGSAVEHYTEAFTLCPNWAVPVLNRALCHKRSENWAKVIEDCNKVLAIDSDSMKAYYYLGQAYLATSNFKGAQGSLKHALELARERGASIKEDIWRALAKAKYEEYVFNSSKKDAAMMRLHSKLENLLAMSGDSDLDQDLAHLRGLFQGEYSNKVNSKVPLREPPSWCICQLTLEVFHDPVTTPSGISYEKSVLLDHLKKVGSFDPVTRVPMTANDIRQNHQLRSAIEHYLDENPWAWSYAM